MRRAVTRLGQRINLHRSGRVLFAPLLAGAIGLTCFVCSVAHAQTQGLAPASERPSQDTDPVQIDLRRAQSEPLQYQLPPIDPAQVAPPSAVDPRVSLTVPDRWRIMETLGFKEHWWDPYNQNTLKGDKPLEQLKSWGPDWFLNLSVVSESAFESRRVPTGAGAQSSQTPGANNLFGRDNQNALVQVVGVSASFIKGDTTFRPPDYEFRLGGAFNVNRAQLEEVRGVNVDPRNGTLRIDQFFGVQEAFFDKHLRNVSDAYDFDSVRVGIQPYNADFRGFLFNDSSLGVRVFGNRESNVWQYNLAWFRRLEKDSNSGLNDIGRPARADDVFVASVYRQDCPVLGHTLQATLVYNRNREGDRSDFYDTNGFQVRPSVIGDVRPHNYDVAYLGLNGDGHFGPWNLTSTAYLALGHTNNDPIAQKPQTITASMFALEASRDFDWLRVRASLLHASGDKNPNDDTATGFDSILENPQFAGADTSYWIRQAVPLIGGGGVALSGRNGVLASLRSSKDQGQSNFVNPGLNLIGLGVDADITPQLRVIGNVSQLWFDNTSVLQVLRSQGNIAKEIGTDVSVALQYRPFMTQNVVVSASVAVLQPGQGYKDLFATTNRPHSVLLNLTLNF